MTVQQRRDATVRIVTAAAVGVMFFLWQELAVAVTGAVSLAVSLKPQRG